VVIPRRSSFDRNRWRRLDTGSLELGAQWPAAPGRSRAARLSHRVEQRPGCHTGWRDGPQPASIPLRLTRIRGSCVGLAKPRIPISQHESAGTAAEGTPARRSLGGQRGGGPSDRSLPRGADPSPTGHARARRSPDRARCSGGRVRRTGTLAAEGAPPDRTLAAEGASPTGTSAGRARAAQARSRIGAPTDLDARRPARPRLTRHAPCWQSRERRAACRLRTVPGTERERAPRSGIDAGSPPDDRRATAPTTTSCPRAAGRRSMAASRHWRVPLLPDATRSVRDRTSEGDTPYGHASVAAHRRCTVTGLGRVAIRRRAG